MFARIIRWSLLAFLAAGWSAARGQVLELGGRYWQMTPAGDVTVGATGIDGTTIDIKDDLGYRSDETLIGFDASLGAKTELVFSYLAMELSARNTLDRSIQFKDSLFAAGSDISSALEAHLLRIGFRYQAGSHGFRGGLFAGLQKIDVEGALDSSETGEVRATTDTIFPVIGAQLRLDPAPWLRLDFSIAGGRWDWEDAQVTFWDGEANLRVNISPLFIGIGYRYIGLDARDDSVPIDGDITFRGPQLIGGLLF